MTKKGFTLIELLVVITIIAILSTIALTMYQDTQKAARDAKRRQDLQAIANAFEKKKIAEGASFSIPATCYALESETTGASWKPSNCGLDNYLNGMPTDPINATVNSVSYKYKICSDGTQFVIATILESTATTQSNAAQPVSCLSGTYLYWIKNRL